MSTERKATHQKKFHQKNENQLIRNHLTEEFYMNGKKLKWLFSFLMFPTLGPSGASKS